MITLYGFGPGFGLPDASPKGQLPFIEDDGEMIADSTFIRAHIEATYGVDLDVDLSPVERAQAWALERMIENHLGWCMVHARWILKANFDKGPSHFFDAAPVGVREAAWRQVNANVKAVGIGRHSDDEIADLGEKSLDALSHILGDKRFLMGDQAVAVDAVAFAMLAAILTPFFDSPLRRRAERFANLVAYRDRLMRRVYPSFSVVGRLHEPALAVA